MSLSSTSASAVKDKIEDARLPSSSIVLDEGGDDDKRPAFAWCCTASVQNSSQVVVTEISGCNDEGDDKLAASPFYSVKEIAASNNDNDSSLRRRLDLTESAGWMEWVERSEDRMNDEGGAGAYDTLRCDLVISNDATGKKNIGRWRKWGLDFHLKRLQNSYRSLLNEDGGGSSSTDSKLVETSSTSEWMNTDQAIQEALKQSYAVADALLGRAEQSKLLTSAGAEAAAGDDVKIQLVRLTFLWSPPRSGGIDSDKDPSPSSSKIIVRGHACSSALAAYVHRPVEPIVVTVAVKGHHDSKKDDVDDDVVEVDKSIPTRYLDAQSKIQSWTRLRKKLERPETYKPPGVSEVLMVRPTTNETECSDEGISSSHLEVLEGLSSNFFVVYKNNTIRTAQDGVLFGYVRHLVLDSLDACGLKLDPKPILLHEAREGVWKEAFITSSSRLIFPISQVLIHSDNGVDFEEYWSDPVLLPQSKIGGTAAPSSSAEKPKWQELLDELMRKGGYPPLSS